jgi:Family of unknown function (DUF5996)
MDIDAAWPALDYESLAPMVGLLNRLVQVGGKYTLDSLFETGWGNIVLDVTPRGLRTPAVRQRSITFEIHYRLLDSEVVIESSVGERRLPLHDGSVADFYEQFCAAASELGLQPPASSLLCEIPAAAASFEKDLVGRTWDAGAARLIWRGFASVAAGLEDYQAPYRGHRPRTGVMWGGFDLSSTRYRARRATPPTDRPSFLQHGMTEEYVSVGFSFGNQEIPQVGLYAYIAPEPAGMETRSWAVDGATWNADAGLVLLSWDALREMPDPRAAIVAFGDAVYAAAVDLAGWPNELVGRRFTGWVASRTPPAEMPSWNETAP